MSKRDSEENMTLSALEQEVLTVLVTYQGELYGLEIKDAMEEASQKASGGRQSIAFGSLYPTLHRLEKKGLIRARWGDEQSGGARRKYYSISESAEDVLNGINAYHDQLKKVAKRLRSSSVEIPQSVSYGVEAIIKRLPHPSVSFAASAKYLKATL